MFCLQYCEAIFHLFLSFIKISNHTLPHYITPPILSSLINTSHDMKLEIIHIFCPTKIAKIVFIKSVLSESKN